MLTGPRNTPHAQNGPVCPVLGYLAKVGRMVESKFPRVARCSLLSWTVGCNSKGEASHAFWLRPPLPPRCLWLGAAWHQGLSQVMGKGRRPYPAPELRSWSPLCLGQLLLPKFRRLGSVNTFSLQTLCGPSSFFFTIAPCRNRAVCSSFPISGSGERGQMSVNVS